MISVTARRGLNQAIVQTPPTESIPYSRPIKWTLRPLDFRIRRADSGNNLEGTMAIARQEDPNKLYWYDEQGKGFETTDSFQGIRCPQE